MSNGSKDIAKQLLEKTRDLQTQKEDPRLEKKHFDSLKTDLNVDWQLLESMRTGVHHKQEFLCLGVKIYLRPLSMAEQKEILQSLENQGYSPAIYEMEFLRKTLCKASSAHPKFTQGENTKPSLTGDTLDAMPFFLVNELFKSYSEFINICSAPINELSEDELKRYADVLEKKPQALKELPLEHRDQIMIYLIERCSYLRQLEDKLTTQC